MVYNYIVFMHSSQQPESFQLGPPNAVDDLGRVLEPGAAEPCALLCVKKCLHVYRHYVYAYIRIAILNRESETYVCLYIYIHIYIHGLYIDRISYFL